MNIDFDGEKNLQYKYMRWSTATANHEDQKEYFGPAAARKDEEDLKKKEGDSVKEVGNS